MINTYKCADCHSVELLGGVLKERQDIALDHTIAATMLKSVETGRLGSLETAWKPGMPNKPHIFWDSDLAKVLEGMAAALALRPDEKLEKEYDHWVDLFVATQQPDGYINTYYTNVEPEKRFSNLMYNHELYCCGHLIEAAVAGYQLLGKRKLLDAMCRYADYLCSLFGPNGTRRGWPGHEELELALVKLFNATGNRRYLELADYFVCDRGTRPNFFSEERQNAVPEAGLKHIQAHKPIVEQDEAVGHAVRAVYYYSGAADVADLTNNQVLLDACKRLFKNLTERRMYVTGGIGSSFSGEALTSDYDLQNGSLMYAESCATMGLTFFSRRMLNITGEEKYASVMERALYNGVLAGISLGGDSYFYTNYLEMDDNIHFYNVGAPVRQEWFDCSCCPTSFARYLTQLAQFIASFDDKCNAVRLHIPAACHISHAFADGTAVDLHVAGKYPYDGDIELSFDKGGEYTLELRLPGWCDDVTVCLNGVEIYRGRGGFYMPLSRVWKQGDRIELKLAMRVRYIRSHEKVTNNLGRVALQRGPLVYCLESTDAPCPVREIVLKPATANARAIEMPADSGLPQGTLALQLDAWREEISNETDALYFEGKPELSPIKCLAIPYALWQNRGAAQMTVWIRTVTQ